VNGIQIKVQGTEEQFKQMTGQCELTEALFAQTLARRIEGMKAEEAIEFILSWFQSVRHMAQASLMSSGIKTSVEPIGAKAALEPMRQATEEERSKDAETAAVVERVFRALDAAGAKLSQGQLMEVKNAINGL